MENYYNRINDFIMKIQILEYSNTIQDKVEYFLKDGKRLRPILCILFSGLDTKEAKEDEYTHIIYTVASCIEQIHCLSLVLDDLPEMDNDLFRRGKQSFHSKYGIDYTNFFIYYMFNRIGLLVDNAIDNYIEKNTIPESLTYINFDILNKINYIFIKNTNMLIDGQYNDLSYSKPEQESVTEPEQESYTEPNPEISISSKTENINAYLQNEIDLIINFLELANTDLYIPIINNIKLNIKKTSSLFNLSICSGFLLQLWVNKYDLEILNKISNDIKFNDIKFNDIKFNDIYLKLNTWANILGYMFQISDDVLDVDDDKIKGNPNLCNIIGTDKTIILLNNCCKWLIEDINIIIVKFNIFLDKKIYFNLDAIIEIIEKILSRIKQ
jgi:geranylgeranyl pyrophosphate synthase